jgi:anti-sigma regulatory factor (Ser/Thr protein kinase)
VIVHRSFPRAPESVPTARHFVMREFASVPNEVLERATVMVSELATNAIQHAGTPFEIRLELRDDMICIEVVDSGEGEPIVRHPRPFERSGRGLRIVEVLSDSWGVRAEPNGEGKTVWFEIALQSTQ